MNATIPPRESPPFDAVIVGAGASAVHAALPLAHAGWRIAIVHPAKADDAGGIMVPDSDFLTLRRTDERQHEYLLGEGAQGVPFGPVRVGAQLTPPRARVARDLGPLSAINSPQFAAMQSFVAGGLGAAWGASVMPWTDEDLHDWPIRRADLQPHYEAVAQEIGVCGPERDDLSEWLGPPVPQLPPTRPDSNGQYLLRRAKALRLNFHKAGLRVGQPRLAVCTREHDGRGPMRYRDLEFWSDADRAVYRPQFTLETLRALQNVEVIDGLLVQHIAGNDDCRFVQCIAISDKTETEIRARRVILAAGTLNTTRIALRSLGVYGIEVPLLSNPYTYYPCLLWRRLGASTRDRRHSLTQVTMLFDPDGTRRSLVQPQVYSYRSLMLHRLVKEAPLPHRDAVRVMQLLGEYFIIMGVFHPDGPAPAKNMRLLRGDGPAHDVFDIQYAPTHEELEARADVERRLVRLVRKLGTWPIKRILPGEGSSIHYAGSLPMSESDKPMTTTTEGELRALRGVYIADGAAFPTLPAKGLTFTLMANARRVATALLSKA
jgi:choline dehydrogenase-like flavoprotein